MRSGYYKTHFPDLVRLTDSAVVRFWVAVLFVCLVVLPFVTGAFLLSHVTVILFTLVGVLGLNVLTGFTAFISLGHVPFLMLGSYGYPMATTPKG